MKKNLKFLVVTMMIGLFLTVPFVGKVMAAQFTDVQEGSWYYDEVQKIASQGIVNGYPDGSFKPEGPVKVKPFIKMVFGSMGYTDLKAKAGEDWAQPYINKGIKTGIIEKGDFLNYDRYISRGEMAKLMVRAIEFSGEKDYPANINDYHKLIADYNEMFRPDGDNINTDTRDYSLKAFVKGLITGYPDGEFKSDFCANRAEACVMLERMIDKNFRKIPELPENISSLPEPREPERYVYWDKVVPVTYAHVGEPKGDFIEPIIQLRYNDDPGMNQYFSIHIKNNHAEYVPVKEDYRKKINFISPKQLNHRDGKDNQGHWVKRTINDWKVPGWEYVLFGNGVALTREDRKVLKIAPGMEIEFETIMKKVKTGETRTYSGKAVVQEKTFLGFDKIPS